MRAITVGLLGSAAATVSLSIPAHSAVLQNSQEIVDHSRLQQAGLLRLDEAPDTEQRERRHRPMSANERDVSTKRQTGALEEVIVTAQKREEKLQDVPISISVLGGSDLDKYTVEGIREVLNRVPGVVTNPVVQGGGSASVAIRGVTAPALNNGSNAIAYYLDSVPFAFVKSAIAPDSNAYDLDRVEVLRGPQGTLYGVSALNGVVRVLTKEANVDEFQFKARGSTSSTEGGDWNYRGDMAVNVPVIDGKLAARAVVGYQDWGGWIDRATKRNANDAEVGNARLKINARPTDQFSVGLSAWLSRTDYGAPPQSDDHGRNASGADESGSADYDAYALTAEYEFERFSLVSMTSQLDFSTVSRLDATPFGLAATLLTDDDFEVFSQEVILNSTHGGPWRWSLGGIYRDAKDRYRNTFGAFFPVPHDWTEISESFAVFGELTRRFLDGRVELTAGARYFDDNVSMSENTHINHPTTEPLNRDENEFEATSPRVVLAWHPHDSSTVYASYAEGFRSGLNQNPHVIGVAGNFFPPAGADTLKNYELGAKGSLLGNRVTLDTAIYYIDWRDVQQSLLVLGPNGVPLSAQVNGDSASGLGVDFSMTARVADDLEFNLSLGWNDLTVDADVIDAVGDLVLAKGERLSGSAEYTAGVSADYVFSLGGNGLEGRFSVAGNYTSEQGSITLIGGERRRGLSDSIFIARTSFSIHARERWVATLFADNINNEEGSPIRNGFVDDWALRVRPRTTGVQLEYHF